MATQKYKPAVTPDPDHNIQFAHATKPDALVRMQTAQIADVFYFTPEQARQVARCLLAEASAAEGRVQ